MTNFIKTKDSFISNNHKYVTQILVLIENFINLRA